MQERHTMPNQWNKVPADDFLIERIKLMTAIMQQEYKSLR